MDKLRECFRCGKQTEQVHTCKLREELKIYRAEVLNEKAEAVEKLRVKFPEWENDEFDKGRQTMRDEVLDIIRGDNK